MRLLVTLALVLTLAGCDSASDVDASRAEVVAARDAWAQGRTPDYTFTYELLCECDPGATVTVRGGVISGATGPGAASARTMGDLFETALQVFEDGRTGSVRLSDSEPHIPVRIDLDPESAPVDGNVRINITRFRVD